MICEKILGSICDARTHARLTEELGSYTIEDVPFAWDEVHKRIQRKVGSDGTELGMRLNEEDRQRGIRQGDILAVLPEARHVLVAALEPTEAIAVEIPQGDVLAAARVAWEVGNTHTQLFAGEEPGVLLVPYSEPLLKGIAALPGVHAQACSAVLDTARQVSSGAGHHHHAEGAHEHGHAHEHGRGHAHGHACEHDHAGSYE